MEGAREEVAEEEEPVDWDRADGDTMADRDADTTVISNFRAPIVTRSCQPDNCKHFKRRGEGNKYMAAHRGVRSRHT